MITRCNETSNDFLNSYLFRLILKLSLHLIEMEAKIKVKVALLFLLQTTYYVWKWLDNDQLTLGHFESLYWDMHLLASRTNLTKQWDDPTDYFQVWFIDSPNICYIRGTYIRWSLRSCCARIQEYRSFRRKNPICDCFRSYSDQITEIAYYVRSYL